MKKVLVPILEVEPGYIPKQDITVNRYIKALLWNVATHNGFGPSDHELHNYALAATACEMYLDEDDKRAINRFVGTTTFWVSIEGKFKLTCRLK